jgi:hypothetical protein
VAVAHHAHALLHDLGAQRTRRAGAVLLQCRTAQRGEMR